MNYHKFTPEKRNVSKPMSEQMQKLAARYEKATGKRFCGKTNAQKIRGMSDEELAEFLCNFRTCDAADEHPCIGCKAEQYCRVGHTGTIDWLQQPAEEDGKQCLI